MPYNGWAFSHSFVEKFALFIRRYQKINEKEAGDGPFCKKMTMNVYGVIIFFIYLWTWMGRLNSWVVSHLALIIGTLCHALGCEFEPWWQQTLFQTQAQHLCFLHDSIWLIWYYFLSVKFVMWIVKQKIENKRNLLKKSLMLSTCTIHLYLISCFWFKKSSGIEPDLVAPMEVASFEVATLIFGQPQIIWI